MDLDIATLLTIDGITTGAVYVLLAIGMAKRAPGTAGLVALLAVVAAAMEVVRLLRDGKVRAIPRALLLYLCVPLAISGGVWAASGTEWPMAILILLAIAVVLPLAPLLDRIVFRPVADASVLLLMIISVALHFALAGVGLLFFGPERVRTQPLTDAALEFGDVLASGQTTLIVVAASCWP